MDKSIRAKMKSQQEFESMYTPVQNNKNEIEVIGQGSTGTVLLYRSKFGEFCAVKVITAVEAESDNTTKANREIEMLWKMQGY